MKFSEFLKRTIKKDEKRLEKLDLNKLYEEQIEERWKKLLKKRG